MRAAIALGWVACLGGCGLVLDLQPPGPDARAPGMDAQVSNVDASSDAGTFDAAPPPPLECTGDADCLDEDACSIAERCSDGLCVEDRLRCDDGIACTVDRCDASQGCTNTPDDLACAAPVPANDCRVPRCDPSLGCQLVPSDALCDDGFACTDDRCGRDGACVRERHDERCAISVAVGSRCDPSTGNAGSGCTAVACADGGDCVVVVNDCVAGGSCEEGICVPDQAADGIPCDDELGCTLSSSCRSGICVGTMLLTCDDEAECTLDSCVEEVSGPVCVHGADPDALGIACNDGVACTGPGTCTNDGVCIAGPPLCRDDASLCLAAMCSAEGTCSTRSPCVEQNRVCAGGSCGACLPGFADCDGTRGCECSLAAGRRCVGLTCGSVVPLDAAVRDGAVDAARPDGGRRDAGREAGLEAGAFLDGAPLDGPATTH